MARKRSGGRGGRSKAYRSQGFRATCRACGKVQKLPERPLPGIELNCFECHQAKTAEAQKSPA